MTGEIDAIFFDVGATLRHVEADPAFTAAAEKELLELVDATAPHDAFFVKLESNWRAYRKRAKAELLDVSEMELWLYYLLPDYPAERVAPNAARLTRLWRNHDGRRVVRVGTCETLRTLKNRGYRLGIIANTITEAEIPNWLCEVGVADCFQTVILSSKVRLRKPDPAVFLLASRCIEVSPERCAHVGDKLTMDVVGAARAGFGAKVLFAEASAKGQEAGVSTPQPDAMIQAIPDLLELFPAKA